MKRFWLFILLICGCIGLIRAQITSHKPYVVNYTRDKYHAASKNWAIGEDERGTMYWGNDAGLLESDGMEWRLYPMPGAPLVRALAVASHDTIYAGGTGDFGIWNRTASGRLQYTSLTPLLPDRIDLDDESFWRVLIDGDYVYFQSFSNIYVYDHEKIWQLSKPNGFMFLQDVGGELWIQEMYGSLYRLKEGKLLPLPGSDFLHGSLARMLLPYNDNCRLVGTADGRIYLYDGRQFTLWNSQLSTLLNGKELNCGTYSPSRNTFYLGTLLSGVYEVDVKGNVLNHFYADNSLLNNTVLNLYEDRHHNVWAALDRGLSHIRYTPCMSYYLTTDRNSSSVYCAALWNDNLLIGTNQGVFYTPQAETDNLDMFSSLKLIEGTQGQVWSFLQSDGKLLCCYNNGVGEIRPDNTLQPLYPLNTGAFQIVEGTVNNRQLRIIVAYNALYIVDKATNKLHSMKQLPSAIYRAEIDHMGNIWLETVTRGVYKCRLTEGLNAFRYYTYYGQETDDTLPAHLRLFKISGRIVFLGDDSFYTYNEQDDCLQPDQLLNSCFADVYNLRRLVPLTNESGWAVTTSAVYRFQYDGYIARILEAHHIEAENQCLVNDYENVSVLNDSLSLICLDAGFIIHNWHNSRQQYAKLMPPLPEYIHIGSSTGKGYIDLKEKITVPYDENTITVGISIDGIFDNHIACEYMLEGVDSTWTSPPQHNSISYARLPWGKYTLHMRSTDHLGNYSDDTVITFEVLTPWYRTAWAYMLWVAITVGLLYLSYRLMQRRLQLKQQRELKEQEALRLLTMNEQLQREIEEKNAEMFTLTSFIIRKNELLLQLRELVGEVSDKSTQKSLTPLYNKINLLLADNLNTEDDWKMFLIKFEQKHQTFFKEIKHLYPQLTTNDLRLCACLKLNMSTKDIASLMNLSVRAVENNRYRLRKKFELDTSQNLSEFLMGIE